MHDDDERTRFYFDETGTLEVINKLWNFREETGIHYFLL